MLNFLIFLLFFIGVCFIIYSVIKFKPVEQTQTNVLTDESMAKLQNTIDDADNAMEELSRLSQNIFDEMSAKYKELLYLYSLIERKQSSTELPDKPVLNKEVEREDFNFFKATQETSKNNNHNPLKTDKNTKEDYSFMSLYNSTNPKHNEIKNLYKNGMSVAEIARNLNLGQGEVSLVLELGKAR